MSSTEAAAGDPAGDSGGRPPKRNRITVACTWCRQRKSRCDGTRPKCATCRHHGYVCEYSDTAPLTRLSGSKELAAIESRLATLERSVTGLHGRVACVEAFKDGIASPNTHSHRSPGPPLFDGHDPATVETEDPTDGIGSIVFTKEEEAGFFGPSSNIAFTRLIVRTTTAILKATLTTASSSSPADNALQSHMLRVSRQPSLAPNRSSLSDGISVGTEPFFLPGESEILSLIDIYFRTTGVLFPYIDRETFLYTYHQLNSTNLRAVRRSWLGLLNMVLAMATSASHGSTLSASQRAAKSDIFFRRAWELCDKQSRHGTSLELVQMLLLMSQYLQGTERSIETWNIHGLAVKAAYQLGLHSPNALKQYPPLEQEIRKRTWFGCILVDRSLSMTMGRPSSIPQKFIKLDLPTPKVLSPERNDVQQLTDEHSVNFYKATITLYIIMGEIVDDLYESNLGCDTSDNVFDVASQLLQFEQKFLAWQHSLPPTLTLVDSNFLSLENSDQEILRYRFILTIRFLNVRILAHRPLLCKYLELLGTPRPDIQQLAVLMQVGVNSLRICAQSALMIITLMRAVLTFPDPPRHLLGAWWFSLYYTFNAALIIYSTLLAQHQMQILNQHPILEGVGLDMDSLHQAIECLSMLFQGNRMTEKCARYTTSLAQLLSLICMWSLLLRVKIPADLLF
ncbi:hypothetical protein DM02DRAFT_531617 [Periconia macrospinosa]|uniref:Zn(2)-C6 fungal-type domain-containing protein n=1 Tax=Periconia macrospinosa TaxID=97972 RepID=A0A2V1DJZ0_9PLEO|nr:hypothetical protein DM02DRAFT_531617 [Periconia macrospinosa]